MPDDDWRNRHITPGVSTLLFLGSVSSQASAEPIQHVPNPAARAANIRFSAASEQFSTVHGLSVTLEIKTNQAHDRKCENPDCSEVPENDVTALLRRSEHMRFRVAHIRSSSALSRTTQNTTVVD